MGGGRAPCCDKSKVKKGPWSPAEDLRLITFIQKHGHGNWRSLPKQAGLLRCGKSCRLRWINYLRPDVKRGNFTPEEEEAIIKLHDVFGNKWSKIASQLPGRTDNEIKNVWNTHLKKRLLKKEPNSIMSSSPSPSSSSTSYTSYNMKGLEDHLDKQDPSTLVSNDCGPINEPKEASSSSSSISSHTSNSSNSGQVDGSRPGEEIGSPFNFMIEIPLESDIDFWNMLDNLDSFEFGEGEQQQIEASQSSSFGEEDEKEIECREWMKYLENELGLVGNTSGDEDQDNPQKRAAEQLVDEIDLGMGYFPMCPSPHNFGI